MELEGILTVLAENYGELVNKTDAELAVRSLSDRIIKQGLANEDTNIIMLKHLTKVARNLIDSGVEFPNSLLEKLYNYNCAGAKLIESSDITDFEENNVQSLHSHFYGHAGAIARILSDKSDLNGEDWLYRCILNEKKSARLAEKIDKKHAGKAYYYAASAARQLYLLTADLDDLNEAKNLYLKAGQLLAPIDKKQAAGFYAYAGSAIDDLLKNKKGFIGRVRLGKERYQCWREAAELTKQTSNTVTAYNLMQAGKAAIYLFDIIKTPHWLLEAHTCQNTAAELFEKVGNEFRATMYGVAADSARNLASIVKKEERLNWLNVSYSKYTAAAHAYLSLEDGGHAAYQYGFAGRLAKDIFKLTQDISWKYKELEACKESAQLARQTDEKHSGYSFGIAGSAAKVLYDITKDIEFAKESSVLSETSAELLIEQDTKYAIRMYSYSAFTACRVYAHEVKRGDEVSSTDWRKKALFCLDSALHHYKISCQDDKLLTSLVIKLKNTKNYMDRVNRYARAPSNSL